MVRMLIQTFLALLANSIGLLLASVLLDKFTIDGPAFVIAVVIFTFATMILGPFIASTALKHANFLMGGIALVTTFVGLFITSLLSDGISITGLSTWIVATLIVWLFSVIANVVLPLFLFKKTLEQHKENK